MPLLNLESFSTAAKSLPTFLDVACEELGGEVRVRRFTAAEAVAASRFVTEIADADGSVNDPAKLQLVKVEYVASAVVDDAGNRFLDSKEGRELLDSLPPGTLARLFNAIQRLSGMQPRVEDSKKN